jgi:putative ABC transport system ATP-binding protein
MIRLDGVEKVYRTDRIQTVALSGVSLAVEEGQFVSVMGPSGCGKSTLLHVMGLLDVATRGSVAIGGQRVTALGDRKLSGLRNLDIGFVFQTFHLVSDLSVLDNVEIPLLYRKGLGSRERRDRALAAIDRVGLSARASHFPSS